MVVSPERIGAHGQQLQLVCEDVINNQEALPELITKSRELVDEFVGELSARKSEYEQIVHDQFGVSDSDSEIQEMFGIYADDGIRLNANIDELSSLVEQSGGKINTANVEPIRSKLMALLESGIEFMKHLQTGQIVFGLYGALFEAAEKNKDK